ncbi:hypothetical protein HI850_000560 [bacterium SPL81]|nr:hypothetical protein [Acinetobacter baumannii]
MEWLKNLENYFFSNRYHDLYYILLEAISNKKMTYLYILKMISTGHGINSSEGTGFCLDQDFDFPEDFCEVEFFIGEMESSTMNIKTFVDIFSNISEDYLLHYPDDKEKVFNYLALIKQRYG